MKLELCGLDCGYSAGEPVLKDINFTVETGHICCILGPNGVGKSTLFKTILTLQKPLSGTILADGEDIAKWSPKEISRILGYVSQFHVPPFPYMVKDVVLLGRLGSTGYFGQPSREDLEIVESVMDEMGISYLRTTPYTEISGGERQLVMIAKVLAQQPQFLVLDEPASNLDFGNMVKVINKIRALRKKGYGIIMTTHSPDQAFMCDSDVVLLQRNRPAVFGPVQNIITEGNMMDIYGVRVKILEFLDGRGRVTRVCSPELE